MYHKLDVLRSEAKNTVNYFVLHPEKIREEIRNYENEIGRAFEAYEMEEKLIFSEEFYKKLEEFSESHEQPQETVGVELDERFFNKKVIKELCKSKLRTIRVPPKPQAMKVVK